jgi:2-dehydropantoate 2-reductase
VRDFISAVMREAKAIGERIGIPIDRQPEDRHQVTRSWAPSRPRCCRTWRRGAVELDALVGAVRELGQLAGVATPSPTPCWAWPAAGADPGALSR